jgi:hypothetical protein
VGYREAGEENSSSACSTETAQIADKKIRRDIKRKRKQLFNLTLAE